MRNQLFLSAIAFTLSLFCANISKAMPCHLFGKDSVANAKKNRPFHAFYSLDFGYAGINPSTEFNNWLQHEGYSRSKMAGFANGLTETYFTGKWMSEYSEMNIHGNEYGSGHDNLNVSFGEGYNFLNTKLFSAYGALNIGLNSYYFYPNQMSSNDFGQYNEGTGSNFEQYALLITPHILLYRNLTNNLSMRPGRVSAIGAGIDAGFNMALFQSKWFYGYSNDRPFSAVTVSGIPNSALSGFYIMGRIGWYFGRQ